MFQVIILLSSFASSYLDGFFEVKQSTKEKIVWFASALIVTCAASNFNQQCKRAAPCKTEEEQDEINVLIEDWISDDNKEFIKNLGPDDKHFTIKPLFESLYNNVDLFETVEQVYDCIKSPSGLNHARNTIIQNVLAIQKIGKTIIKKYDDWGGGVLSKEREILKSNIFDCSDDPINQAKIQIIPTSLLEEFKKAEEKRKQGLKKIDERKKQFIFDNFTNTLAIVKNSHSDKPFLHSFYDRHSAFTEKYFKVFPKTFLDSTKNRLRQLIPLIKKKTTLEEIHTIHQEYKYGPNFNFKFNDPHNISLTKDAFFALLERITGDESKHTGSWEIEEFKTILDQRHTYETFISAVNNTKSIIEKYNHGECGICASVGSPVLCNGVRGSNFLCDTCHDIMQKDYVSDVEGSPIAIVCPYCRGGLIKEENRFSCDATTTTKKKTTAPPPPQNLRQVMRDAGISEDEINANMGQNQGIGQNVIIINVEQLHARLVHLRLLAVLRVHLSEEELQELHMIRTILQRLGFG